MWCSMTSNGLGGHLTSDLKSATLITLVSMCILPPMASEVIWPLIWNKQPWLPWYPCAYCLQWHPKYITRNTGSALRMVSRQVRGRDSEILNNVFSKTAVGKLTGKNINLSKSLTRMALTITKITREKHSLSQLPRLRCRLIRGSRSALTSHGLWTISR